MKKSVYIFVEGVADKKFIQDYIKRILPDLQVDSYKIVVTGGWNIKDEDTKQTMNQNTDSSGVNLVIFDADDDFAARKAALEKTRSEIGVTFELFLFPNNQENGTLENLLENIILDKNRPIFQCWDGYEQCLRNTTIAGRDEPLTTPAKKTKIYAYLEALLGKSKSEKKKIKEVERDYRNKDHWNLEADYLKPLKMFLTVHLLDRND
ncbi:MAG: hypothetical protein LBR10_11885 [Prevotellaceae bacterium]|jgi:predicted ATP-dependent endonuclease of OLD family|nr:hypothetical protein [Prevotellaceae bacterium]